MAKYAAAEDPPPDRPRPPTRSSKTPHPIEQDPPCGLKPSPREGCLNRSCRGTHIYQHPLLWRGLGKPGQSRDGCSSARKNQDILGLFRNGSTNFYIVFTLRTCTGSEFLCVNCRCKYPTVAGGCRHCLGLLRVRSDQERLAWFALPHPSFRNVRGAGRC